MSKQLSIFNYSYQDYSIEFERKGKNVMVNATAMAKVFSGKRVNDFLENKTTEDFINSCLKNGNSRFLNVASKEDLVVSKQKSGTWMHRILALKFASWLNPDFELWVYSTIDHILFGYYKDLEESLQQSAERRVQMQDIMKRLIENEDFLTYKQLEAQEKKAARQRSKHNRHQMDVFVENAQNMNQPSASA